VSEALRRIVEDGEPLLQATGFRFTEGPTWHPDGYLYFVDVLARPGRVYRLVPGEQPVLVREDEGAADGTTFDMQGTLLLAESYGRRVSRLHDDGQIEVLAESFNGKRLNRPNDITCRSDGSIYFSDPGRNAPLAQRELPENGVYRIAPDGELSLLMDAEHPNGLAFAAGEDVLYVANTRHTQYLLRVELNPDGSYARRSIFADMSADDNVGPDGLAVDLDGRVYATGSGGTWVFSPTGEKLGVIATPELPANLIFGGDDMKTLFITARTSVYAVRMKVAGLPHPWAARR
jgi:gluconolactonase